MVAPTPRLEEYVERDGPSCSASLDGELDVLASIESRLDSPAFDRELAVLSAASGETRYRLLTALLAEGERCVCELDTVVDVSDSAISHALADLEAAGLVERRKSGRWRLYDATERAEVLVAGLREATEE
jgi:DNA-binding transcriptional ArsR family regulator